MILSPLKDHLSTTTDPFSLDRDFALEAIRVTEAAALAASLQVGRGDEDAADQAAVDAMRKALGTLAISGKVVIGEGERDEAPHQAPDFQARLRRLNPAPASARPTSASVIGSGTAAAVVYDSTTSPPRCMSRNRS